MILVLDGSIAIAPIEYEVSLSKIGFHVVPALSVIHTPPEPAVIYQIFSLFGCIAISEILPDKKAGPIFLNLNALRETFSVLVFAF